MRTLGAVREGVVRPSVAYWYPEPYWGDHEASAIKNVLPFFDQVAILLPKYMYGRHVAASPWLTGPLEEMGLLRILEPEEFVDADMTSSLVASLRTLIEGGAFDDLPSPGSAYGFQELSQSRLGWNADVDLSRELIAELTSRGLARAGDDGVSVPLHPLVRTTTLVLLSQLSTAAGRRAGIELLPVTPNRERVADLVKMLGLPGISTPGQVIAIDTEAVGVDLSSASIEDVVRFRAEHGPALRRYQSNVRDFCRHVSIAPSTNAKS